MKNKINKQGFTLIELLVVVLIIGILAAIALPQYKKSILRTRFVQIQTIVKNLVNAQTNYYLINGCFAGTLEDLDIQYPQIENISCDVNYPQVSSFRVMCNLYNSQNKIFGTFSEDPVNHKQRCCAYNETSYIARNLCIQLVKNSTISNSKKGVYMCYTSTNAN